MIESKILNAVSRSQMVGCDRNTLLLESKVSCSSVGPHSRLPLIKPKLVLFSHNRMEVHRFTVVQVCRELHSSRNNKGGGGIRLVDSRAKPPVSQHRFHRSSDDPTEITLDVGLLGSLTRDWCWADQERGTTLDDTALFKWHSFQVGLSSINLPEGKMVANHNTLEGMRTGSWICHLICVSLWRISRMATIAARKCWKPAL